MVVLLPLQEADSRKISCRPERRAEFAEELRDSIPDGLNLLTRWGLVVDVCHQPAAGLTCRCEQATTQQQQQQLTGVQGVAQHSAAAGSAARLAVRRCR